MNKLINKYLVRILFAVILSFMIKIYDHSFAGRYLIFDQRAIVFILFMVLFVLVVWEISDLIFRISNEKWLKSSGTNRKFIYLFIIFLIYGVFVTIAFSVSYAVMDEILFDLEHYPGSYFDLDANIGMYFGYLAFLLFKGQIYVFNTLKENEVKNIQLMKENYQAKFEALKNQIDPHFFFNSLSVLSGLVHQDAEKSEEYINQLSKLYRYILDNRDKMLVEIEKELEFLESYMYLLKVRHGSNVVFDYEKIEIRNAFLPPNSLQIPVENAIKHNIATTEEPLLIKIRFSPGYIIIENRINLRNQGQRTTGLGLGNISKRYELIGKGKVVISDENGVFIVKMPII